MQRKHESRWILIMLLSRAFIYYYADDGHNPIVYFTILLNYKDIAKSNYVEILNNSQVL